MGPRARDLLSRVTPAPLDNAAFPFGAIREIGIGYATVLASRRTYVGELGWELYVPAEFAGGVYDALMRGGRAISALRNAGYYAIESLRLEKGYRAWGRELTPDYNPYEAGLGFAVQTRQGRFHRPRRAARREGEAARAAAALASSPTSPDTPIAHGGELILRDGEPVGEVTSAAYGHTVGGIVALGYVRRPAARASTRRGCGALRDRHRGRARAGARKPEGAVRSVTARTRT